ncbi:hypothetical protein H920_18744 [Fukomys damarensis]|uniref:Uncharacterized protein n=1 Tax=Fukomys damarensis TaxID=885580 RepID=A0A091CPC8_FUKDA|nr:hypothetical protein H920_18744 [Fukomys damarensis]
MTKRGAFGPDASGNTFTSVEFTRKSEPHDHHLRNKSTFLCTSSERVEEEQVDNFLDLEDMDVDEEMEPQMSKGEVEEDISSCVPSYIPSAYQSCTTEEKLKPTMKGKEQKEEILGDEVQPFSLDEDFDYDSVTLTPKFTSAEMETLRERLKQERKNTNPYVREPHS